MKFKNLLIENESALCTITINRPEKLNALNLQTLKELDGVFQDIEQDKDIKGVFITGAGTKAFVAGADISEIHELDLESGSKFSLFGQSVFNRIENCSRPVFALINGFALGGGCELALACHLRLAADHAKFGQPEINLGLIPGYGGTQRLPRLVGKGQALEILLSGNLVSASKALEIGLVNRVVSAEDLITEAKILMQSIMEKAPLAASLILKSVNLGQDQALENALNLEAELFGKSCASEDMAEGTSAFLEKRKPVFKGK